MSESSPAPEAIADRREPWWRREPGWAVQALVNGVLIAGLVAYGTLTISNHEEDLRQKSAEKIQQQQAAAAQQLQQQQALAAIRLENLRFVRTSAVACLTPPLQLTETCETQHEQFGNLDLQGLSLADINFDAANLKGADLKGADLTNAQLLGGHLDGAHLDAARLDSANFDKAILDGATLTGAATYPYDTGATAFNPYALFVGASLKGADLRNVNLESVDFAGAELAGADFTGAKLAFAEFGGADLTGAKFDEADLTGAHFDQIPDQDSAIARPYGPNGGARLSATDFTGANLTHVSFSVACDGGGTIWPKDFLGRPKACPPVSVHVA